MVEYSLTEYGRSLMPIMDAMARWGGATSDIPNYTLAAIR